MDPYEALANAVIIQAAKDYRKALRILRNNPRKKAAMREAEECEDFFRSKWYTCLTNVEGEYMIERLRQEVKNE